MFKVMGVFGLGFLMGTIPAFGAEEAGILPAGIKRFRFVAVGAPTVREKFNSRGEITNLGGANRTVRIGEMARSDTSGQLGQLVGALNNFRSRLGDNLYTANLYQDVEMQQNIFGAAFEYGLSRRWNVGVRFRVVQRNLRTRFRVDSQNNASAVAAALAANVDAPAELNGGLATVAKFDQAFWEDTVFRNKGYEAPANFSKTELGYTELGAKYEIYQDERFLTSVLAGIRVPTGKDASLTNPLDQGTGGNHWGAGIQGFGEWTPIEDLSFGSAAKYEYYFSDTKSRAVPKDENDALPSLLAADGQVQEVKRRTGGKLDAELSLSYNLWEPFDAWVAYQYTRKAGDRYSGPGNLYYAGLGRDSNYTIHAWEGGFEYSTIPAYRRSAFFMPLQVSLLYNGTLAAINAPNASYVRMDVKVYF